MLITRQAIKHQEVLTSPIRRLLSAAVADSRFRDLLLSNPARAIEVGYGGETFTLSDEDKRAILDVHRATSLADFTQQILTAQDIQKGRKRQ
ncbi:MAG: hypothetical protein AAF629_03305 [Chloroflexota bacterium]